MVIGMIKGWHPSIGKVCAISGGPVRYSIRGFSGIKMPVIIDGTKDGRASYGMRCQAIQRGGTPAGEQQKDFKQGDLYLESNGE